MMMASVSQQHLYSVVKYFVLVVTGPVYFLFHCYAPITIAIAVAVVLTHFALFYCNIKRKFRLYIPLAMVFLSMILVFRQIRIACLLRNSSRFIVL